MARSKKRRSPTPFNPELAAAARFDAYCASLKPEWKQPACDAVRTAVQWVSEREDASNRKGYKCAIYFTDHRGSEVASVHWNFRGAFVEVKGEHTPTVAAVLRAKCPHQVSRVDICTDFRDLTAYKRLLKVLLLVKKTDSRLREQYYGEDDHPEEGFGYRLGRSKSLLKVKIYEKGRSKEFRGTGVDDWTRLEFQFNFSRKAMKEAAAGLDPMDLLSTNLTARKVMNKVFGMKLTPFKTPPRLPPVAEISVGHMLTQYRRPLREVAAKKGTATVLAWVKNTIDGMSRDFVSDQQALYLSGGSDCQSIRLDTTPDRTRSRSVCPRDRRHVRVMTRRVHTS
jgi:hypothetical protein